jgi:hypothetical protein
VQQRSNPPVQAGHGQVEQPAAGAYGRHVPVTQTSFVAHLFEQLPQWSGSRILSTQALLHSE